MVRSYPDFVALVKSLTARGIVEYTSDAINKFSIVGLAIDGRSFAVEVPSHGGFSSEKRGFYL